MKNTIDLDKTIKKFARQGHINETLHIYCEKKKYSFNDNEIIYRIQFKKTKKCLMCSWTAEHFGEITDTGKLRLNIDKLLTDEYDYKLIKIFNMYIGTYSFTITTDYYKQNNSLNNQRFNEKFMKLIQSGYLI